MTDIFGRRINRGDFVVFACKGKGGDVDMKLYVLLETRESPGRVDVSFVGLDVRLRPHKHSRPNVNGNLCCLVHPDDVPYHFQKLRERVLKGGII